MKIPKTIFIFGIITLLTVSYLTYNDMNRDKTVSAKKTIASHKAHIQKIKTEEMKRLQAEGGRFDRYDLKGNAYSYFNPITTDKKGSVINITDAKKQLMSSMKKLRPDIDYKNYNIGEYTGYANYNDLYYVYYFSWIKQDKNKVILATINGGITNHGKIETILFPQDPFQTAPKGNYISEAQAVKIAFGSSKVSEAEYKKAEAKKYLIRGKVIWYVIKGHTYIFVNAVTGEIKCSPTSF